MYSDIDTPDLDTQRLMHVCLYTCHEVTRLVWRVQVQVHKLWQEKGSLWGSQALMSQL